MSDLERALSFYRDLLGFEITMMYGRQAAFLSAGGYHHHIGLNTWHSEGMPEAPLEGVGLCHTAIAYPTRHDLALILKRLIEVEYPLTGASDHGVSEAIYLNDPDGNGVELYWDKPKEEWPMEADGSLNMFTKALNVRELLREAENDPPSLCSSCGSSLRTHPGRPLLATGSHHPVCTQLPRPDTGIRVEI